MFGIRNAGKSLRRLYAGYYQSMFKDGHCFYCGEPATTVDHSVPVAFLKTLADICRPVNKRPLVPACRECNSLAGSKLFSTLAAKRRYIQGRIRTRYKRVLKLPAWEEYEIDELGYGMQTSALNAIGQKVKTVRRLTWPHQNGALREAVMYYYAPEHRTTTYEPKPANKKRDEYELKLKPLLTDLDRKFAGSLPAIAEVLNHRGFPTFERRDWTAANLRRTLWRLGLFIE